MSKTESMFTNRLYFIAKYCFSLLLILHKSALVYSNISLFHQFTK